MRNSADVGTTGCASKVVQARRPQIYSKEEWNSRKPLILRLYVHEGWSLGAVTARLQQDGFCVNKRMLKTRIKNWNCYKKLRFDDMQTALQLLADSHLDEASSNARFLVHGRVIEYSDVRRYFRRKGIADPLNWLASLPPNSFTFSAGVQLVTTGSSSNMSSNSQNEGAISSQSSRQDTLDWEETAIESSLDNRRRERSQPLSISAVQTQAATMLFLFGQPPLHNGVSRILYLTDSYCTSYLRSNRSLQHTEPEVHNRTTHAIFAQHIQDGIALLLGNDSHAAFECFSAGFALVKDLITDNHPMALTLVMSIICDLDSRQPELGELIGKLIYLLVCHTEEMAITSLGEADPLTHLFHALKHVEGNPTQLALLIARKSVDCLSAVDGGGGEGINVSSDWKTLYLRERLLDCLYYAQCDSERANGRRALLHDQEHKYGPCSRNVLWTLMNVADDDLRMGRTEQARYRYRDALIKADQSTKFGRAKTRAAALEGLAQCSMAAATQSDWQAATTNVIGERDRHILDRQQKLIEAIILLKEAEAEACAWFDPSSRRLARLRTKITDAKDRLI